MTLTDAIKEQLNPKYDLPTNESIKIEDGKVVRKISISPLDIIALGLTKHIVRGFVAGTLVGLTYQIANNQIPNNEVFAYGIVGSAWDMAQLTCRYLIADGKTSPVESPKSF